jgi:hypothetical protein
MIETTGESTVLPLEETPLKETPRQALIRTAAEFQADLGAALGVLARDERRQGLAVLDVLEDFASLLQQNDRRAK